MWFTITGYQAIDIFIVIYIIMIIVLLCFIAIALAIALAIAVCDAVKSCCCEKASKSDGYKPLSSNDVPDEVVSHQSYNSRLTEHAIKSHIFPGCRGDQDAIKFSEEREKMNHHVEHNTVLKVHQDDFKEVLVNRKHLLRSNNKIKYWQCGKFQVIFYIQGYLICIIFFRW